MLQGLHLTLPHVNSLTRNISKNDGMPKMMPACIEIFFPVKQIFVVAQNYKKFYMQTVFDTHTKYVDFESNHPKLQKLFNPKIWRTNDFNPPIFYSKIFNPQTFNPKFKELLNKTIFIWI